MKETLLPNDIPPFPSGAIKDLPAAQRKVIDYLLSAEPSAWASSADEIGKQADTSGVTVVRTAQALGYEKLAYLRLALFQFRAETAGGSGVDFRDRVEAAVADVPASELLGKDARIARDGLDLLTRKVPGDVFERAVDLLAGSDRIVWRGVGPSGFVAQYAALHCQRIGHPSVAMTQMDRGLADELMTLQRKDAVVVLSYGAKDWHSEVVISEAKARARKNSVVLVTDDAGQELAATVDLVLECQRGERDQLQSHAVTMVLLESLILGVAEKHAARRKKSTGDLKRLRASIVEGRRKK